MTTTIEPPSFTLVFFDAESIRALVERLVDEVGLPTGTDVRLEVDETTPLGRARLVSVDPITLQLESGALEDPRRPRQLSTTGATDVLGRLLFEARDRLDPAFGDPPAERDLTLLESSAWQTYCVVRLARLGHPGQRQRRLYQFRTRHGFNDEVDAQFRYLWHGDGLTWADIQAASRTARAAG